MRPSARSIPSTRRQTGTKTADRLADGLATRQTKSDGQPRQRLADAAPYGQIIFGDSLLMFTELRQTGPQAEGTLTYSQATDPTSKWHSNLTRLYAKGRYVPLRYSPASLRSDHGARVQHLTAS